MSHSLRLVSVWLACASLGCAFSAFEEPWKTYDETVTAGVRERIATHGRWDGERGGPCRPEQPPQLAIVRRPARGIVEFAEVRWKPKGCEEEFLHAAVYYTAERGYTGQDRFTYYRVNPSTKDRKLVAVEVTVVAPAPAPADD